MVDQDGLVAILRQRITDEIVAAMGMSPTGLRRKLLGPIFYPPAQKFSRLIAEIDQEVGENGTQAGSTRLLTHLVDGMRVFGADSIPQEGPAVIASNHPGAFDSIALLSSIPRRDVKVVVSDVPFIRSLPQINPYMIYTPSGNSARMTALRQILRHLQDGGALLIFASGVVDPDPAVLPGAKQALANWYGSLELMLKHVPDVRLTVAMVSGVLAPACLRSPLTRLLNVEWRKRKLAEFLQIIQTLLFGSKFGLHPAVSFGESVSLSELRQINPAADLRQAILHVAERQLEAHLQLAGIADPGE